VYVFFIQYLLLNLKEINKVLHMFANNLNLIRFTCFKPYLDPYRVFYVYNDGVHFEFSLSDKKGWSTGCKLEYCWYLAALVVVFGERVENMGVMRSLPSREGT
jgi:hypothetical protein